MKLHDLHKGGRRKLHGWMVAGKAILSHLRSENSMVMALRMERSMDSLSMAGWERAGY